jgi:HPt (histidine-containing phosphotransfer) domain-containing protein
MITTYRRSSVSGQIAAPIQEESQDDLLREIRQSFTADGMQQIQHLINAPDVGFDLAAARVTAHRWKGAAAQLGYPEISQKARVLEDILQRSEPDSVEKRRVLLADMSRLLAEARSAGTASPPMAFSQLQNRRKCSRFKPALTVSPGTIAVRHSNEHIFT